MKIDPYCQRRNCSPIYTFQVGCPSHPTILCSAAKNRCHCPPY